MKCRICNIEIENPFLSLGKMPLSNSLVSNLYEEEIKYPLDIYYCSECHFVQTPEFESGRKIFSEGYPYFSSYSTMWMDHCKNYVDKIIKKLNINRNSLVVEIGSNDGSLLEHFKNKNVPVLGIEPVTTAAMIAIDKNVPTQIEYFDTKLAIQMRDSGNIADLIVGNNILAHNPNLHDFVEGLKILLNSEGVITIEFPHLLNLIELNQFDTIYHEHYSYFSLYSVIKLFNMHELEIINVEEIPTHGGSLRIYTKHSDDITDSDISNNVFAVLTKEISLRNKSTYENFHVKVELVRKNLLNMLEKLKIDGKKVTGYGAPAKGATLLNYCNIGTDLIEYTVDLNSYKQGKYLPGSHIPIKHPSTIKESRPDYILILPWNIKEEIMNQLDYTKQWNCKFIVPIPEPIIIDS